MDYATSFVQLGLDYCESMFDSDLLPAVNAFKSAQLFNPRKLTDLKPDAKTINTFSIPVYKQWPGDQEP